MGVLFPFRPQTKIDEELKFLTTVSQASYGNEVRASLRQKPRRAFKYTYLKNDTRQIAILDASLMSAMGAVVDLPIWSDVTKLRGIALGSTTINTGPRFGDYRDGKEVLLWKTDNEYEVLEIDSSTATTLTFTTPLGNDYPTDVLLAPVLASMLSGTPQRQVAGHHQQFAVSFEVVDNVELTGGAFDYTFEGDPVWGNCHISRSSQLTESYQAAVNVFDNQTGLPEVYKDSASVTNLMSMAFWLEDQEAVQAFRKQCHAIKGRLKRFWLPDHASKMDLYTNASAGATQIIVGRGEYTPLILAHPVQRATLYVSNGTQFQAIGITSIAYSPVNTERITLDGTLSFDLYTGASSIGFLVRHRLNTDRIRLTHKEDTSVALSAVEVLGTGVPYEGSFYTLGDGANYLTGDGSPYQWGN